VLDRSGGHPSGATTSGTTSGTMSGAASAPPTGGAPGGPAPSGGSSAGGQLGDGTNVPGVAALVPAMDCDGVGVVVDLRAAGDLDGDGLPDAAVEAHCDAGAGSPPSLVEVWRGTARGFVDLGAAVQVHQDLQVTGVRIGAGVLDVTAEGYSGDAVPRCCPDTSQTLRFHIVAGPSGNTVAALPL
jgi:hypothetical protein